MEETSIRDNIRQRRDWRRRRPASCGCMNFTAGFSAIPACCEFGCRPDTISPENEGRRYPVFYLNDGQNLFDPATAYIGVDWQVGETAARLIAEGKVPPLMIVGIDNAQKDRAKEYLPYRSMHPPVLRPQGKRYPDFLLDEVMPFVGQRYRIAGGPENTGLGGSSLGAIISLFTVMDRPGVFGRLLLESPSLFISNRQLLRSSAHSGSGLAKSLHGDGNQGGWKSRPRPTGS